MRNNEREIAIYTLMDIIGEKAFGSVALRKELVRHGDLARVQKAFVTELVNGVLRNLIYIDYVIAYFSKTPIHKLRPFILNNLRVGIYQMKYLDKVPDYAVCSDAVKLAKAHGFGSLAGFVNGVLRAVARCDELPMPDGADLARFLSVKYSYQLWMIEHFLQEFGEDATRAMLEANAVPPEITIAVNTVKISANELAQVLTSEGVDVKRTPFVENALIISKTDNLRDLDSFKRGLYHVMDISSMLAVLAANPVPGEAILDLCAAPGGKSMFAAYLTGGEAKIIMRDIHEHKIGQMRENMERTGISSTIGLGDAAQYCFELDSSADLVIIDAPCSALGNIRKQPDIKLNRQEQDINDLAALQRNIVAASWAYAKPGGRILYSTCTLSRKENEDNVRWMTENFALELLSERTIKPQDMGTDGFYIAVLRRIDNREES